MFRNRTLQVDLVKKDKQPTEPDQVEDNLEKKIEIIDRTIEKTIKKIGLAVCAYVLLDTFRKVTIERAKSV